MVGTCRWCTYAEALKRLRKSQMVNNLLTVAVTAVLAWFIGVPTCSAQGDDPSALAKVVLAARKANREKLTCGILQWETESGKPSGEPFIDKNNRLLFLDGRRAYYRHERQRGGAHKKTVYDGEEARTVDIRTAEYDAVGVSKHLTLPPFDDWLVSVEWGDRGAVTRLEGVVSGVLDQLRLVDAEAANGGDSKVIVTFRFEAPGEGFVVEQYDLSRGGAFLKREEFSLDSKLIQDASHTVVEPIDGFWFPAEVVLRHYKIQTGTLAGLTRAALDLKSCSFNDRNQISSDEFKIEIQPKNLVRDHRVGSPPVSYRGVTEPVSEHDARVRQRELMRSHGEGNVELYVGWGRSKWLVVGSAVVALCLGMFAYKKWRY